MTLSNLRNEIGSLSSEEKYELLDVLWESIAADGFSLTDAQRDELDRRLAENERDPNNVIPSKEVWAGLFKKQ